MRTPTDNLNEKFSVWYISQFDVAAEEFHMRFWCDPIYLSRRGREKKCFEDKGRGYDLYEKENLAIEL